MEDKILAMIAYWEKESRNSKSSMHRCADNMDYHWALENKVRHEMAERMLTDLRALGKDGYNYRMQKPSDEEVHSQF